MKKLQSLSKLKLGLVIAVVFAVFGAVMLRQSNAATSGLYLSGSSSVTKGSSVTLSIYLNNGVNDGVEATLSYDTAKLQFVSINSSGSAFPIQLAQSGGSGTVQVSRGILGSTVSGNAFVAKVTFKALAGGTTATIGVSGNSTYQGSYTNPATPDFGLTLNNPASSTPPPSSTPKPSTSTPKPSTSTPSTSNNTNTNTNTNNNTSTPKPSSSSVTVTAEKQQVEFNRVVLGVTTSKKVTAYVNYGTDQNNLNLSTKPVKVTKTKQVSLDPKLMVPGTTYYYKVIATDSKGNKTETAVDSITTKGYKIKLLIQDAEGLPLRKKKVALHSDTMTGETDDKGNVTFENVSPGNHKVEYESGADKHQQALTVNAGQISTAADGTQSSAEQFYTVVFANVNASGTPIILPVGIAIGLLVVGLLGYILMKRRSNMSGLSTGYYNTPPTQVHTGSGTSGSNEDLMSRISGGDRPDPGSLVAPKDKDHYQ